MYIAVFKNNGKDYLRLMESYRTQNAEGKVAIRKRIICNIGPLSKFDDGQPEYLERLRESFRLGAPLILNSFDISIPIKLFRKTELKSQIRNINMGI
ncbi:MAG: hypothetical protein IJ906_08680 [Oscillospiraceae bacterium]|nr:hypothetical protein [Oscillospiraceae bacterium]